MSISCCIVCWQLLAADIRHERNVILQCIRFLVQHFQLHKKDHENRQYQADHQQLSMAAAAAAISENCDVKAGDCVDVSRASKFSKDQNMNIYDSSMIHSAVSKGDGCDIDISDIPSVVSNGDRCDTGVSVIPGVVSKGDIDISDIPIVVSNGYRCDVSE